MKEMENEKINKKVLLEILENFKLLTIFQYTILLISLLHKFRFNYKQKFFLSD